MNRLARYVFGYPGGVPRTRGDEPVAGLFIFSPLPGSPHARG